MSEAVKQLEYWLNDPYFDEKTKQELLKKFKSVKRIRSATIEELQSFVGPAKAKKLVEYFKQHDSEPAPDSPTS